MGRDDKESNRIGLIIPQKNHDSRTLAGSSSPAFPPFVEKLCPCLSYTKNEMLGNENSGKFTEHNICSYCFIFHS